MNAKPHPNVTREDVEAHIADNVARMLHPTANKRWVEENLSYWTRILEDFDADRRRID